MCMLGLVEKRYILQYTGCTGTPAIDVNVQRALGLEISQYSTYSSEYVPTAAALNQFGLNYLLIQSYWPP